MKKVLIIMLIFTILGSILSCDIKANQTSSIQSKDLQSTSSSKQVSTETISNNKQLSTQELTVDNSSTSVNKETDIPSECQHLFGIWTVAQPATCKTEGSLIRVCKRCRTEEKITIEKTDDHTEVIDEAEMATCYSTGKTEGKHCSACNTVIIQQNIVPVISHNYQNGVCTMCGTVDPVENYRCKEFQNLYESAESTYLLTIRNLINSLEVELIDWKNAAKQNSANYELQKKALQQYYINMGMYGSGAYQKDLDSLTQTYMANAKKYTATINDIEESIYDLTVEYNNPDAYNILVVLAESNDMSIDEAIEKYDKYIKTT